MNSRFEWGRNEFNSLREEFNKIADVVKDYANLNGYSFDKQTAINAYGVIANATLLREESKWNTTSQLLPVILNDMGMLDVINDFLHLNRTVDDYVNNTYRLSYDLDNLYDEITKQALYIFFYVLVLYSKIKHETYTPFGKICDILCALNYGLRGQDTAKTLTSNYIYQIFAIVRYFPLDRYTIRNYFNWIQSGFICDYDIYNGK